MITIIPIAFRRTIKPRTAIKLLNVCTSKIKRNKILSKCGVRLSDSCTIASPFFFEYGNIQLFGDVFINANCVFLDNETITIHGGTMVGPNVTLTTVSHHTEPDERHRGNIVAPICIGKNVWIGAGVVVLPGVKIGDNSVIAANSVVSTDVPENVLFAGSPAKLKKKLF